jgi:hypothetical protein
MGPHPNPLPASGEREGPAKREGEGRPAARSQAGHDEMEPSKSATWRLPLSRTGFSAYRAAVPA